MNGVGKAAQVAMAGGGFYAGYIWGVLCWAARTGQSPEPFLDSSLAPAALVAGLYSALLVALFWPWIPPPRVAGLRSVVLPVIFAASLLLGLLGIQGALWILAAF